MREKEKNFYIVTIVIIFLAFIIYGKSIEAILMLILGHLIEIKYEIQQIRNPKRKVF